MDIRIDLAGDAAAGIAIPFAILLLGWIVTVAGRIRIARRQAEVWGRLVDKLDPTSVGTLFGSGNGRTLEALLSGPERPHARIIVAAQAAVVLLPVGVVLLGYALITPGVSRLGAAVTVALAVGLGGAAAIGYWLSNRWGLLTRTDAGEAP
ncbi:MAG TPA: hypothetical protein VM846_00015 [Vicinamibacterales bacterium]|nr:hypothetical protein [Vicinamibacterales bacterium]